MLQVISELDQSLNLVSYFKLLVQTMMYVVDCTSNNNVIKFNSFILYF